MKFDLENLDPEILLNLAELYAGLQGTALLYSGGKEDSAKTSFLCFNPTEVLTLYDKSFTKENLIDSTFERGEHSNPWDTLSTHISFSGNELFSDAPEWVGYLAYEMGAFCDSLKTLPHTPPDIPLAKFYRCGSVLKLDHSSQKSALLLSNTWFYLKDKERLPTQFFKNESSPKKATLLQPPCDEGAYTKLIEEIQCQIGLGNVYQVNLSHEIKWAMHSAPYPLFAELAKKNPSPFSAYVNLGNFSFISSSPERLIEKRGLKLEARPIKGTAPRGKTAEEDNQLARNLLNSMKDRAELLMITDLIRNDLGKISRAATVVADPIVKLEKYTNVFHLLSIIKAEAKETHTPQELLRSIFPGGSITGCPKLNAMELIYRLENRPRGIYTGSIGYFTSTGDFDFNIAIRTLQYKDETLSLGLGGAIVYDSIPSMEYQETLDKGASVFQAL